MPAPSEADLPRLHREIEALRLRNQLDPKRFYRKDEGEGKGIKGLPKYFAVSPCPLCRTTKAKGWFKVGQIIATESPFGGSSSDNLPKTQRKRTLVDELIDDAETKRYAKKKFNELQTVRSARGRKTLRAKQALRKPKWEKTPSISRPLSGPTLFFFTCISRSRCSHHLVAMPPHTNVGFLVCHSLQYPCEVQPSEMEQNLPRQEKSPCPILLGLLGLPWSS